MRSGTLDALAIGHWPEAEIIITTLISLLWVTLWSGAHVVLVELGTIEIPRQGQLTVNCRHWVRASMCANTSHMSRLALGCFLGASLSVPCAISRCFCLNCIDVRYIM